jgi:hypothetical protein
VRVGTITEREPEWDAEQRALILAHLALEADRGPHGQPMSETTSPLADPNNPSGWHYESAPMPRTDWYARAIAEGEKEFYAKYPEASRAGHLWYAKRIDD